MYGKLLPNYRRPFNLIWEAARMGVSMQGVEGAKTPENENWLLALSHR